MENEPTEHFDYEVTKQKLRERFRTGQSLFGKGGAFVPLLQEMLNSMLDSEMDGHLDERQRDTGNRRNGKSKKLLKTSPGTIEARQRPGIVRAILSLRLSVSGRPSWLKAWRTRS